MLSNTEQIYQVYHYSKLSISRSDVLSLILPYLEAIFTTQDKNHVLLEVRYNSANDTYRNLEMCLNDSIGSQLCALGHL